MPSPRNARASLAGLIASLATWGLFFCLIWPRMLFERSDGLYAGWRTVWADWAHHFAFANVFAYQPIEHWFSHHPLFLAKTLDYPFVADALSGLLMRAGVDRVPAFVLPSVAVSLALVGLLYGFYLMLLHRPSRAVLATTLFFTNGGLGFLAFAIDLTDAPALSVLDFPPREYSFLREHDIEWANVVATQILPQRGSLLGLVVALSVLLLIARASGRGFEGVSRKRLLGLGLLSSFLLVTYAHAYLVLVLLCAFLFLFNLHSYKAWLFFAASAAVPSLAILLLFYSGTPIESFISWYPGWLTNPAENRDVPLWLFLWLNWGVFLPLAAVSFVCFRYDRSPLVLAGLVLFVLCFLVRFMPLAWDNTKILIWAHLLLCVPVARYLAHLWEKRGLLPKTLAVALTVFATASGFLELWRLTATERLAARMWPSEEITLARAFREISAPDAVVLCSDHHHHWVPSLSGRRVLLGYRGWLIAWGIDYSGVERDVRTMLAAGSGSEELLRSYGVDFVVIGPTERTDYQADEAHWLAHHELVLETSLHKVFAVTPEDVQQ